MNNSRFEWHMPENEVLTLRIENARGSGPYQNSGNTPPISPFSSNRHPLPEEDGILTCELGYDPYFGFSSFSQLDSWFAPGLVRDLLEASETWYLSLYVVPIEYALAGDAQAVFDIDAATKGDSQALHWVVDSKLRFQKDFIEEFLELHPLADSAASEDPYALYA